MDSNAMTISPEFTLSAETVSGILITAFEGGINYWCESAAPKDGIFLAHDLASHLAAGGSIILNVRDGDTPQVELTPEAFCAGFSRYIAQGRPWGSAREVDLDAEGADVLIQLAVFGTVVFG